MAKRYLGSFGVALALLWLAGCGGDGNVSMPTGPAGTATEDNVKTAAAVGGGMQNAASTNPATAQNGTSLAPGVNAPTREILAFLPGEVRQAVEQALRARDGDNECSAGGKVEITGDKTDADSDGVPFNVVKTYSGCKGSYYSGNTTATYESSGELTAKDQDDSKKFWIAGADFGIKNLTTTLTVARTDRATLEVKWTGNGTASATRAGGNVKLKAGIVFSFDYITGGKTISGKYGYYADSTLTPDAANVDTEPWKKGKATGTHYYVAKSDKSNFTIEMKYKDITYASSPPHHHKRDCPYFWENGDIVYRDGNNNSGKIMFENCKYEVVYNGKSVYKSP